MTTGAHDPRPDASPTRDGAGQMRRWLLPALLLVAMVVLGRAGRTYWPTVESTIAGLGFSGYLLFIGVFLLLTVACFPVSILGFSAGVLFGPVKGLAVLFPTAVLSGLIMFWLGKGLLRDRILSFMAQRPRLQALDRLAGEQATRLNVLTRLSPLNYGVSSYTLAAGRTTLRAYFAGMLAILPSTTAQVWLGSLGSEAGRIVGGRSTLSPLQIGLLVGGLVFFAVLSWQVGKLVRRAWRDAESETDEPRE